MGVNHYENFPVASILLPGHLRRPVELIYAFARSADDFADEGDIPAQERLDRLQAYDRELDDLAQNRTPSLPLFVELGAVIQAYGLPIDLFRDLLSAFSQDVIKNRYADFAEVMDYCRRSANPVGRLLLHLYGAAAPANLALSDHVCSSLQLINFLQDIDIDYLKGRIYLTQDDMQRFNVSEDQIARRDPGNNWAPFMHYQIERTQHMLQSGAPLGHVLSGRIGLELRMIVMGGQRILDKLHRTHGNIFKHRPVLRPTDWIYMLYRALIAYR